MRQASKRIPDSAEKTVRELKEDLDAAGIVSKVRTGSDGSRYGGQPIARGALYLMLQNRSERGEIVHKGKSYPGEHEAIVDETLWDTVQAILSENRARPSEWDDRQRAKPADRDFIRCSGQPDEPDACEQERHSVSVLHLAVIAGRVDERQSPGATNPGGRP